MTTFVSNFYRSIFVKKDDEAKGLGTLMGVFIPSLLLLFGVVLFMRLGWIVGQVGIAEAILIMSFAAVIALFTTFSLSAIATNIEVGKGGVYYIISRSLGLEVGTAVGLPLYLKQTLSISFSVVGFAEALHDLFPMLPMSSIGIATLILLTIFAATSLKGALKVQMFIFIPIVLAFISFFMGGPVTEANPDAFSPQAPASLGFWAIFAIFFPAITGIESSVSLSGDLKNPSKSLPLGAIGALVVTYVLYITMSLFLARHVPIERLASDPLIMQDIARVPSLIIAGIWGTTLCSALGGLITAPRTLVAIAEDGVVSKFFAKTSGASNEPRIATLTTFAIAFLGVYYGSVNIIAPLLTMTCLICYAVLNFSAAFETYMENPSWRPRFRVHWVISFTAAMLCILSMLMIDSGQAITALCFLLAIYLITQYRNVTSSWDDIRQGILMFLSRFAIYRLAHAEAGSSRSWRPHFLVFTDKPEGHSNNLLQFSQAISQNKGFLTMASILPEQKVSEKEKRSLEKSIGRKLEEHNIQALVQINYSQKVVSGMHQMIENYGLGPLMPNTIVFGGVSHGDTTEEFAKVIQSAYQKHCNVVIISEDLKEHDKPGDIHIWWDDATLPNTEFMLILAYMLQRNPMWKKAKICLKAIVSNELIRQEKLAEIKAFAKEKRFYVEPEIYISSGEPNEYFTLIQNFSKDAGIVFLSLRSPNYLEPTNEYAFLNLRVIFISNESYNQL